jgi:hypothetical protein
MPQRDEGAARIKTLPQMNADRTDSHGQTQGRLALLPRKSVAEEKILMDCNTERGKPQPPQKAKKY